MNSQNYEEKLLIMIEENEKLVDLLNESNLEA
jgi:hypothetical protein